LESKYKFNDATDDFAARLSEIVERRYESS